MLIIWIRTIRHNYRMLFSNKLCFEISLWSCWSSEFVTVPWICLKEIRETTVDSVPGGGFLSRFVPEGSMGSPEPDLKPILGTGSRFILRDRYLALLLFDFLFFVLRRRFFVDFINIDLSVIPQDSQTSMYPTSHHHTNLKIQQYYSHTCVYSHTSFTQFHDDYKKTTVDQTNSLIMSVENVDYTWTFTQSFRRYRCSNHSRSNQFTIHTRCLQKTLARYEHSHSCLDNIVVEISKYNIQLCSHIQPFTQFYRFRTWNFGDYGDFTPLTLDFKVVPHPGVLKNTIVLKSLDWLGT